MKSASMAILHDVKILMALAWPVIISRIAILSLALVDTIMVGHYATQELAYLGIGLVPSAICILFMIGMLLGTLFVVSRHYGAGEYKECGAVWWRSLPYGLGLGVIGMTICLLGEQILLLAGQTPEIAEAGGRISSIIGYGLPLAAIHISTGYFLEGIKRVRPGMVIMLAANLLNIVLNWVFVNGLYGMPEMGAEGSAWATFGVRVLMVVSIMIYVWWMVDYEKYGVRQPPPNSWRAGQENRRLGYASGLSIGIENTAFNSLSIIAGMLGTMALATHTISINFFGLCFMFGLGVGTSTAVLVGNANGAKNWPLLQRLIWVGLGTQMFLMIVTAGLLSIFSQQVARIYTDEPELIVQVGGVLAYASLGILLDAGQSLMAQTLRARGDAWSPTLIHFFCFGLVMIPFSYVSAVHFERGVYGLFDGLILGTLLSFILGIWRNRVLNHRMRNVSMSEILSPETEIPDPVA